MSAQRAVRTAAWTAVAMGLWCVADVSVMSRTLDNGATVTWIHRHEMKTRADQVRTTLFAAAGGGVWRASVSVPKGKTRKKNIPEDTANAQTLTVRTGTAGTMCKDRYGF